MKPEQKKKKGEGYRAERGRQAGRRRWEQTVSPSREAQTICKQKLGFLAREANGSREKRVSAQKSGHYQEKKRELPTTLCCFSMEVLYRENDLLFATSWLK